MVTVIRSLILWWVLSWVSSEVDQVIIKEISRRAWETKWAFVEDTCLRGDQKAEVCGLSTLLFIIWLKQGNSVGIPHPLKYSKMTWESQDFFIPSEADDLQVFPLLEVQTFWMASFRNTKAFTDCISWHALLTSGTNSSFHFLYLLSDKAGSCRRDTSPAPWWSNAINQLCTYSALDVTRPSSCGLQKSCLYF